MATQAFELYPPIQPSYFILALPPGGATGGGEKSGKRSFIAFIRSFKPTTERNPMARSASAQGEVAVDCQNPSALNHSDVGMHTH
jgi:hypothetical protein